MVIEEHHGRMIVCQHTYKPEEIVIGSRWQGSSGSVVTVESICNLGWVTYSWTDVNGLRKTCEKESFAFQCRYCLIVE